MEYCWNIFNIVNYVYIYINKLPKSNLFSNIKLYKLKLTKILILKYIKI